MLNSGTAPICRKPIDQLVGIFLVSTGASHDVGKRQVLAAWLMGCICSCAASVKHMTKGKRWLYNRDY
jgi:hypothetical protein